MGKADCLCTSTISYQQYGKPSKRKSAPTQRHDPAITPVSDNCRGSGLWQDRRMDVVSIYNETPRMASA